jgi:hypothetical protein
MIVKSKSVYQKNKKRHITRFVTKNRYDLILFFNLFKTEIIGQVSGVLGRLLFY